MKSNNDYSTILNTWIIGVFTREKISSDANYGFVLYKIVFRIIVDTSW